MAEPARRAPARRLSLRRTCAVAPAELVLVNGGNPLGFRLSEKRYTSMKDLMASPAAATESGTPSPVAGAVDPRAREIPLRNRLVEHAARAYLRPMAPAEGSRPPSRLRRFLAAISCGPFFNACIDFVRRLIGAIRVGRET